MIVLYMKLECKFSLLIPIWERKYQQSLHQQQLTVTGDTKGRLEFEPICGDTRSLVNNNNLLHSVKRLKKIDHLTVLLRTKPMSSRSILNYDNLLLVYSKKEKYENAYWNAGSVIIVSELWLFYIEWVRVRVRRWNLVTFNISIECDDNCFKKTLCDEYRNDRLEMQCYWRVKTI